jgi:hypothetical protein
MGQAFDREGNVLSEAFGDTKREVFDKLIKDSPEAEEIRIKSYFDKKKTARPAKFLTEEAMAEMLQKAASEPMKGFTDDK